jgi:DNA-binding NtrC family response regulator
LRAGDRVLAARGTGTVAGRALLRAGRGPASSGTGTLTDLEKDAIVRTLAEVGGNRRQAAKRLGIGLRTLYDKINRYGLS